MNTFFKLFFEGGWEFMLLVTLSLTGVFFSAWKAPNWVREFGLLGLAFGVFGTLIGVYTACADIEQAGEISMGVLAGGIRVISISGLYGIIVYIISLIIRIIQRPRI